MTASFRERLWPFLGGIARQNKMKAIEIGGIEDHVHILLSLPATMPIAKALQLIKGGSSKWVHETFPEHRLFAWQEKYGAFSVSESRMDSIIQLSRFNRYSANASSAMALPWNTLSAANALSVSWTAIFRDFSKPTMDG